MLGSRYTVQQNDSLWSIAEKQLKDPEKWPLLFEHNNKAEVSQQTGSVIDHKDLIYIGQKLYIPDLTKNIQNSVNTKPKIRYVYFKSKARQYEQFKSSYFLKGVTAPQVKIDMAKLSSTNFNVNSANELEYNLRLKLARSISEQKIEALLKRIDNIPEVTQSGLIYMDVNYVSVVIRPSKRFDNNTILIRELNEFDNLLTVKTESATKRILISLGWAGFSCSGAVLSYVAITAEGVLIPFTGSLSAAVIPLSVIAASATSASCGINSGKLFNELSGNGANNDYLDYSKELPAEAFRAMVLAIDALSLTALPSTIRSSSRLLQQLTSKNLSKQNLLQRLKHMPRADRKRLLKEIIKRSDQNISTKKLKTILKHMNTPKIISQTQVRKAMIGELSGAIGTALGLAGSSYNGSLSKAPDSANLILNRFAIAFITDVTRDL